MGRIRYFSVRESIRDQQMSKFVLDGGTGNWRDGNHRQSSDESGDADQQNSCPLLASDLRRVFFDGSKGSGKSVGFPEGPNKCEERQRQFQQKIHDTNSPPKRWL